MSKAFPNDARPGAITEEILKMYFQDIEAVCVNDDAVPWIPFDASDAVAFKYYKIDPIKGEVIVVARNRPDVILPEHTHTGQVIVYTISGSWKYKEHSWIARRGSVVYETAATRHTPVTLPDDGEVVALNIVQGESEFFDANGKSIGIETWRTHMDRYLKFCRENGIQPRDLTTFSRSAWLA
jgi:hypothetical protein